MRARIKAKPELVTSTSSDMYTALCKANFGVGVVKEFRFHETRRWRFDYAIPDLKIAIEIDGGVWVNGRHNRPAGFLGDMEKFNAAASLGWLVLKFTPQNQYKNDSMKLIRDAIGSREKITL